MDIILYVAGIMAFAPTLALMYAVLRKYTYPAVEQPFFSDPAFFSLFVVGLVAGTLLITFYAVFLLPERNIFYTVLFAAVQCLVFVAVLNLKRFHGKSDSVFYGYGIGLGQGCTTAFGIIFFLGTTLVGEEGSIIDITGYVWLFLMALSYILMLSAIGTTIGEGIARLKPMEFTLQGILINATFYIVLLAAYLNFENYNLFYGFLIVALVIAAVYFYYIMYVKLSRVVKEVLKMEGKTRKDVPK